MFNSLSMILLCAWAWTGPVSRVLRRITLGLAVSGLFSLSTIAAHAIAASSRDPHLFAIWSYTLTAAYLAVVLYWIATLKPDPTARTSTKPVL
jgi:hypothetical protein